MRRRLWIAVSFVCACGSSGAGPSDSGPGLGVRSEVVDSDHDGLCDGTERDLGTDPHALDSDRDGLPDLIEIANGFDPSDPDTPAPDQLAQLRAELGASLDFRVRVTIDGEGQGATGSFQSITAIYGDGISANDFFAGSIAVAADPIDAARSVDAQGARFEAVLGHTRLTYSIHFEYSMRQGAAAPSCRHVYPFRYSVKGDDGGTKTERMFLLAVVPTNPANTQDPAGAYCLPAGCQ